MTRSRTASRRLYNGDTTKAQEYFRRVLKGHVWVTWGFVGSETELLRKPK